jgi:hypothetical protein
MSPGVYAIGGKKGFDTAAFYQDLCGSFGGESRSPTKITKFIFRADPSLVHNL